MIQPVCCKKCGDLDPEHFFPSQRHAGTLCKPCMLAYTREWKRRDQENNPEKIRAYRRKHYHKDVEKSRRRRREWDAANPEKVKARQAENRAKAKVDGRYAYYRHGVTLEERRAIEEAQNYECQICRTDLRTTKLPSIDHHHATGAIRGILCGKCNAGLGWFETKREAILVYLAQPPVHPGHPNYKRRKR